LAAKALPNGFLHPIPEFQWSTEGGGWTVPTPMASPFSAPLKELPPGRPPARYDPRTWRVASAASVVRTATPDD
jgi:hypothetical protein